MQTTITARHCEISEALRERALTVVERLGGLARRPMESTVVFDTDAGQQTAELRLHVSRGEVLVARGEGADHRTALDRAEEKLRRQLERTTARPRRSRAPWRRSTDAPPPRLRLPARRPAPARGADRRPRAGPPDAGGGGREPRPGAGRLHRPVRAEPAPRLRRDRDHLPPLAHTRASARPRWPSSSASTCPASSSPRDRRSRPRCSSWPARAGVPVLRSKLKTAEFYRRIKPIVEEAFAPRTTLHGSLADVYGVGLLFMGRSGIGKSECVLDLVERGHRLVADDVVQVTPPGQRRADRPGARAGRAPHGDPRHRPHRHSGAVRRARRAPAEADRGRGAARGLGDRHATPIAPGSPARRSLILDVAVPRVVVPLNPGKNITVISEVVAMMHLLRYSGVDVAAAFNARLIKRMKEQRGVREYLQEDYE